jgi:uncharacterized protein YmfQ (DUF2313 family)
MKNFDNRQESVFTKKVNGGKKRNYFIDIKQTRGEDYYIVLTENSKKETGIERHKIFIYKEDINRFTTSLVEATDKLKSLMPDYNFEEFDGRFDTESNGDKPEDVSW